MLSEAEFLERHYGYELTMLMKTHDSIGTTENTPVIKNALIESFCLHARALLEFFTKGESGAGKYAKGSYKPHPKGSRPDELKKLLNTQIAHVIFDGRTSDPDKKSLPPNAQNWGSTLKPSKILKRWIRVAHAKERRRRVAPRRRLDGGYRGTGSVRGNRYVARPQAISSPTI
jgi:hypothetical protein